MLPVRLFQNLINMDQKETYAFMRKHLSDKYDNVIATKDYIVAVGEIPIALVAHLDTVFDDVKNKKLYINHEKNILVCPTGAGFDDKAGLFAILELIQRGLRPSIILTTNEEQGGVGALALAQTKCPIPDLRFLIELDRQGYNDCVFYQCDNSKFRRYIEKFGFEAQVGTYSDITFLMTMWRVCGVNLSIGYKNEHSIRECLMIDYMWETIDKVENILKSDYKKFYYKEDKVAMWWITK